MARFGADAMAFVNSEEGIRLRLRGVYARVLEGGVVRPGDVVRRLGAVLSMDESLADAVAATTRQATQGRVGHSRVASGHTCRR